MMCGYCVFRDLLPNFIPCDFVLEAPFRNLSSDFQGRIEPPLLPVAVVLQSPETGYGHPGVEGWEQFFCVCMYPLMECAVRYLMLREEFFSRKIACYAKR